MVDIGGGWGETAATILAEASVPPSAAIIFDLPHVIVRSKAAWEQSGSSLGGQVR